MKKRSFSPQRIVPPGNYVVSHAKKEILIAHLGSCVGLTLCDRHAGVGGLIHLLLPEPTGIGTPWQPVNYASTGLPLFIKALEEAGAARENLEACVAGGALVGPISEKDLNLDIGGRTADTVERVLKQWRIPIRQLEIGGRFGCCLSLNLQTWKSDIEPIDNPTHPPQTTERKPTSKTLDKVIRRIRPIPQVALKIIRMIREEDRSMTSVSKEIRQDQVISANVLKLCNSSFFAVKQKIDSIDRALIVLGEKHLLQLAVSASVESFFPEAGQGYSLCKGGLYQHALGTAVIAEKLAEYTGRASTDLAYTGGLLHDIGKVVLDQYMSPAYPIFYRRIQDDGLNLIPLEKEILGITHPEAGRRLAVHWSLPKNLIQTIEHHHCPEKATTDPALIHLVYLADLLMSRFAVGQELERLNTDRLPQRLAYVGLDTSQLPAIIDLIPSGIFRTALPS